MKHRVNSISFWNDKKVLVTGGGGFVGSHLVEKLINLGAKVTVMGSLGKRSKDNLASVIKTITLIKGDSRNLEDNKKACKGQDVVMNLAAVVGGIEYNRTHQASIMRDNLLIASNTIEAARTQKVKRFLVVSSACVYPRQCSIPTPETEGFLYEPEPTNGGYGWAKRMAEKLGMYYHEQYGMDVAIARPYNCFGPRDHFDTAHSHVIAALIKRIIDGENPLNVWGSGKQTRAFLYVDDFVDGLLLVTERNINADPINIGSKEEITIKKLVELICKISKKNPTIIFDTTKPDGSPRRNCDTKKAQKTIDYETHTSLETGLKKTVDWYRSNYKNI